MTNTPTGRVRLDVEQLYLALDRARRDRRISGAELLRQAGITSTRSTWTRIAVDNRPPDAHNLAALLHWLGNTDLAPYITRETTDA